MENFDINSLDIKTLRLLLAIHETGSVTAAAQKRNMTQSTASYGLDKLRHAFADPLFIREGQGVIATERGLKVILECLRVVQSLDRVATSHHFDPLTSSREFTIAATSYEIETIVSPLIKSVRKVAPNVRLNVEMLNLASVEDRLKENLDIILMSTLAGSANLLQATLLEDEYVTFYDSEYRDEPATLDIFCAAPHALSTLGGKRKSDVDTQLAKLGRSRSVYLVVEHIEALAPLMKGTDLITTLPRKFSQGLMAKFDYVECPLTMPILPIHIIWHALKDKSHDHIWLREMVKDTVRKLKGP